MGSNRLRNLRKGKGWTQEEAAKKLGLVRSTYSNYESGKREPDFETATGMAKFYGVSVDYLMGNSISSDQAKNALMDAYDRLPQEEKKIIDDMIQALEKKRQK